MSDNCRVSEALFVGLCDYVGTPTDVTVRREMHDMVDIINKPVHKYQGRGMIVSGSYREGFRVTPSDIDIMYWFLNHKVITDISQYCIYDPSKHSYGGQRYTTRVCQTTAHNVATRRKHRIFNCCD